MFSISLSRRMLPCLILFLLMFSASAAQAVTVYVNPVTGDNSRTKAQATNPNTPWRSLNTAIFGVADFDIIEAQAGTYTGMVFLDQKSNRTIQAAPGARPILKPGGGTAYAIIDIRGTSNITIRGFELDGSTSRSTADGILITGGAHHITIADCIVHDCGGGGIGTFNSNVVAGGPGGEAGGSDYITFEDNVVYGCCANATGDPSGMGLHGQSFFDNAPGFHSVIRRNRIFNNIATFVGEKHTDGNGIIIDLQGDGPLVLIENNLCYFNGGRGIHVFKSKNVAIRNNTTYQNCQDPDIPDGELTAITAGNVQFTNNIAYGKGGLKLNSNFNSTNITFSSNLYFNGTQNIEASAVLADPQFRAPGTGLGADFRVGLSSLALNSGTSAAGSFAAADFLQNPRPQGAGIDKGAFELMPPAAPLNPVAAPGNASVALSWNAAPEATTYTLKRATTSNAGPFGTLASNLTGTSYPDSAVSNGTTYFYVVSASNPGGESANSRPVNATPLMRAASSRAIISEFRFRGASSSDEYVEIYNTLTAPLDVSGWTLKTNRGTGANPLIQTTLVPANTPPIPARGHFLFSGAGYGLSAYGASNAALSDDVSDDSGALLLDNSNATQDAVSFASSNPMFREGNALVSVPTASVEGAWVRQFNVSLPRDTGSSLADFVFVSTSDASVAGSAGTVAAQLGAPSPEGLSSPAYVNNQVTTLLLDPNVSSAAEPNRTRIGSGNSGFIIVRRTIVNKSGRPLTQVRFTVTRITSLGTPSAPNQADVRLVSSDDEPSVAVTGGNFAVFGTALEFPSALAPGGALNSSLSFTSTLATPLPTGQSRSYSWKMQVVTAGNFAIAFNIEAIKVLP